MSFRRALLAKPLYDEGHCLVDAGITSMSGPEQILLRFDSIVGTHTNQVPPGSRVEAAMLDLASVVGNAPGRWRSGNRRSPVLDNTPLEGYKE